MNWHAVEFAIIAGGIGATLWAYKHLPRLTAWLLGAAAAAATVGVTAWLDALAGLTAQGTGLTALLAVLLISGLGFWFEGIRKHQHHRIRTPVIAGTFGTALMVAIGSVAALTRHAGRTFTGTGTAMSEAVTQVHSGHAAHALPHGTQVTVLFIGLAIVLVLVAIGVSFEKRKKGGPGLPITSGRKALPAGRRR